MKYKYELRCYNTEKVAIDNAVEVVMYKPAWSTEIILDKKIGHDLDSDRIYEELKNYLYGKECHYLVLKCKDRKCKDDYDEIGAQLVGKSLNTVLFPILTKVKQIHLLGRSEEVKSLGGDENPILVNELSKVKEVEISKEYYIANTAVKLLSNININAIRVVTELGDRVVLLEGKEEVTSKTTKKAKKKRRRRSRSKKKR